MLFDRLFPFERDTLFVLVLKHYISPVSKLALSVFCLTAAILMAVGFYDDVQHSDVAIVLGAKANPDGTPSARLTARLDRAVELFRQGVVPRIIVSGGTGKEGVDEAYVMKQYLLRQSIPEQVIIMDSHGDNTWATANNAQSLMQQYGMHSVVMVSQYFHMPRCRLAMLRVGVTQVSTAHAYFFEWRDVFSVTREVAAFYSYYLTHGAEWQDLE